MTQKIEVVPVQYDEKEILRNLLEKYDYEFSLYDNRDVNALGLYGYQYLDNYWTDDGRFAFFIKVDGKLAGFVMTVLLKSIFPSKDADNAIFEFFVMHKYRRMGVGKFAFYYVLDKFPGTWEVQFHPKNETSRRFWTKAVDEYTRGAYTLAEACSDAPYPDGSFGSVITFSSGVPFL